MVGTHHEEHKDGGNENPGCTGVRVPDVWVNTLLFTWSLHDTFRCKQLICNHDYNSISIGHLYDTAGSTRLK